MQRPRQQLLILTVLAVLALPGIALAYDSQRLQSALESLSPSTVAGWEQKALAGDALTQNVTGMAYKYGKFGVPQDHAASIKWYRKAAEQGDADAQFNLGRVYDRPIGMYAKSRAAPQDDLEAVNWYGKAAQQGYAPAQSNLAEIYAAGGSGVPQDFVQAYFWMSLAASSGNELAQQKREAYAARLSSAQMQDAQRLLAEWKKRAGAK